jgi:polyketide biosynthesis acyl carrier protein
MPTVKYPTPMEKSAVFAIVKNVAQSILVGVDASEITPEKSLVELGANSIDRVEVVTGAMEQLGVKVPRVEFSGAKNLQGLVDILHAHLQRAG